MTHSNTKQTTKKTALRTIKTLLLLTSLGCSQLVFAEVTEADQKAALAKKLSNPIAALISLPMQYNYDSDIGPSDLGNRSTLNIQPVIPFSISEDWNLISRTILPVINQQDIFSQGESQTGIGDVVQSIFFSPKAPTNDGWIWGVGPVLLLPTGSDAKLSADKFGLGPTAVALKQDGPWTYGGLANHIVSIGGPSDRADISATFLQPFVSYNTKTATTLSLSTESTYDWKSRQWAVPVNASVSQMIKLGDQLFSVGAGVKYWLKNTANGPKGLGFRLTFTMLFPK
ncbi:MAG TPA: hypothetical protein DIS98_05880 [Colwellia sp.]|nr:hypothetical protein [Colwellia sp.]